MPEKIPLLQREALTLPINIQLPVGITSFLTVRKERKNKIPSFVQAGKRIDT